MLIQDGNADSVSANSDSVSANLDMHEGQGSFKLDLTTAKGGASANPFVESGSTATGASGSSPSSAAGSSSGDSTGEDGASSGGYGGGGAVYAQKAKDFAKRKKAVIAHGVVTGNSSRPVSKFENLHFPRIGFCPFVPVGGHRDQTALFFRFGVGSCRSPNACVLSGNSRDGSRGEEIPEPQK